MTGFDRHEQALAALAGRSRLRHLIPRAGHDFASNDYLGLAGSAFLRDAARAALDRDVAPGAGGSRLLRGNDPEHEALETEAAAFFGAERALFMGGGFQANQALFSTLPMQGDLVLHDDLIHASAHEGLRLGRADLRAFPHNNVTAAESTLRDWRAKGGTGRVWIAVESLYSMEGDCAPLADLAALATTGDAVLVVDEAHATGLHGPSGRGLTGGMDHANLLTLHTCGKGLGVSGALICGAAPLIDMLINKARPFIFATAPSPLNAALVRAALRDLQTNPARRETAQALIAHAHGTLAHHGLGPFTSQILPILTGTEARTMQLVTRMQARGFDIRGVRPPTVPRGTSRLRISITGNVTPAVITAMAETLAEELESLPA
ncbi:MAG: 8-amino-7-oxononanoate synthase [Rhodobacteraceae bacterium]|nr:8-amino-7-oxononanoate synthase [Paracoccaceae bacterium]